MNLFIVLGNYGRKIRAACLLVLAMGAQLLRAADLTAADVAIRAELGRDCPVVYLWPEGKAPDESRDIGAENIQPSKVDPDIAMIQNVTRPSITIIAPPKEKNTGAALVLGPGGGYVGLSYRDAIAAARELNPRGIAVVLLKYRVPKRQPGYAANLQPLQDAQRAMGILRLRAAEWASRPTRSASAASLPAATSPPRS